jgi:trehalose synthase
VLERIEVHNLIGIDQYRERLETALPMRELERETEIRAPNLRGRRLVMLSSTALGGGVAEMLRPIVSVVMQLGIDIEWLVMRPSESQFFALTKRLHNLIHGLGDPRLSGDERALYDRVSDGIARELRPHLSRRDILIVHDPQPLGAGARVKRELGMTAVWRCHIGLDIDTEQTRAAWSFLEADARAYDHSIFSAPEYIPPFLAGRSSVIPPGIDPLSPKNSELRPFELVEILCDAALLSGTGTRRWEHPALRLRPNGRYTPAEDLSVLFRPTVTQISRWDRLKGWLPLLEGFCRFKGRGHERLQLLLAGPDPTGVADDPEARDLLADIAGVWRALTPSLQKDVAVVVLPLASRVENALMVNALQRSATIVAQNSIQEGFGLTVTEAMWKGAAVMGTRACGIRQQIRDGLDGKLVRNPENPDEIAAVLEEMLRLDLAKLGRAARRRVADQFLIFEQIGRWLRLMDERVKLVE